MKTEANQIIDRFFKVGVILLLCVIIANQTTLKELQTKQIELLENKYNKILEHSEKLNDRTIDKIDLLKDRIYRKVGNTCITPNDENN